MNREPGVGRRIGMALYGDLTFDSRVQREAASLAAAGFHVTLVCLADGTPPGARPAGLHVTVVRPRETAILPGSTSPFLADSSGSVRGVLAKVGWLTGYVRNLRAWGQLAIRAAGEVDAWHLHDLTALAGVAPSVPRAVPIVYDAHELFVETGTALRLPRPARALLRAYERRLVGRTIAVVTVNDAVAAVLSERYRPRRTIAVHNCPARWQPPAVRPSLLRDALGLGAGDPIVLYHGALSVDRGIEQLMSALLQPGLERAHLALLGYGEMRDRYTETARIGPWAGRVHVLDPVPPANLLDWIASADVGAMPIQPSTLNHRLSTPNKLFECIAAGVPVVVSDFPVMRRIVAPTATDTLGEACDPRRVEDVARAIRALLELDEPDRVALQARCVIAARERWNWETQSAALVALHREIGPCPLPAR